MDDAVVVVGGRRDSVGHHLVAMEAVVWCHG
jgi:hypothetical protein